MSDSVAGLVPFLQHHAAGLVIFDLQATYIEANVALAEMLGYSAEECAVSPLTQKEIADRLQLRSSEVWDALRRGESLVNEQMELTTRSEDRIYVLVSCSIVERRTDGNHLAMASLGNITELKSKEKRMLLVEQRSASRAKLLEELLVNASRDLDDSKRELQESYRNLESLNYAMKLLMTRLEDQKKELEERIAQNFNLTVQPILDHMKARSPQESFDHLLETLDYNIRHITSLFGIKLADDRRRLSRRETQVCQMIRAGKNTREIAQALGLTYQTVIVHRKNIRKKFGLKKRKQNLMTFVMHNLDSAFRPRSAG